MEKLQAVFSKVPTDTHRAALVKHKEMLDFRLSLPQQHDDIKFHQLQPELISCEGL